MVQTEEIQRYTYLKERIDNGKESILLLKLSRWGLAIILAGLTLILGKKIVLKKECARCPDYASCPGVRNVM